VSPLLLSVNHSETAAVLLGQLFKGANAPMGISWVDSVNTGWSELSLHRLVVSNGTLRAAKTRDVYGHFRTATQMQRINGTYWRKGVGMPLTAAALALSKAGLPPPDRLSQLRTAAVGGFFSLPNFR
jgi:hypothetical protein